MVWLREFERLCWAEVARRVGASVNTVKTWVRRWKADRRVDALEDRPRTGRPPTVLVRAQAIVLGIACRRPGELGRLEGTWRQVDIAEEASKQGAKVSRSTVQRILALAEVKPHKERYYLFTKKDRPDYEVRRDAICDAYQRDLPEDELLVCIDEKTGIQALGLPKGLPHGGRRAGGNGRPGRIDQHYRRHGSRSLVAAVDPTSGKLLHSEVYPPKGFKSRQMVEFLMGLAAKYSHVERFHVVWDNGSTHCSQETRAFLASPEGQRFVTLFTPAHASWLNLCENFFSRFSRRYLRGQRYDSVEALEQHLLAALEDYQHWARPMAWTYNPHRAAA
jgi:transposase